MCRVRNSLPPRHKFTNEQQDQQQSQQHQQQAQQHQQLLQQHSQQQQQQIAGHEANIASLQELAQELRMETEKIMGERARLKDIVSNKEFTRKHKKVNEEVRPSTSGIVGPAERRQMELRALLNEKQKELAPAERRQMDLRTMLSEKQKELEALLKKEKVLVVAGSEGPTTKQDSRAASVANQSYNSEMEEPDSRSEQILIHVHNENYRGGGDSGLGGRSTINTLPSHLGSTYASDSDSASRTKSNQRNRGRRRPTQERQPEEANPSPTSHTSQSLRHEQRIDPVNVNTVPPISQSGDNPANMPYPHMPPPWNSNKSNQDMRANQFTQNSHSQTMERLLGTPQMSYPPQMPFNMLMPYGMVGGCGCGCGLWGAWCWQQLVMQQREIHQLRDQLNHLEERWRVETASHTLNNQVPPGNRANNYWDNFRSYSRQNLLSASSKTNADGHLGVVPQHNPHPLVERSHNTLHPSTSATPPANTPKRNVNATQTHNSEELNRHGRSNVTYERSLSFSSAPDVLNVNQNNDESAATTSAQARNLDDININRQDATANPFRNLNITNPIPEIIQSHANNINTTPSSLNSKKKSSSKLPAKNSANRRNYTLEYAQTSNINIASTSEAPNLNLASANRDIQDKAASKLFDFLQENVYSEVSALIGVNESHPDFLIQLFRELQLISSDPLRQRVLQSIRNVLTQYPSIIEHEPSEENSPHHEDHILEAVSTTTNEHNNYHESNLHEQNACSTNAQIDNGIVRFLLLKSEDLCSPELLDMLANVILNCTRQTQLSKKRLLEILSKYEGMRVCDVSGDILENLPLMITLNNDGDESTQHTEELSESSILQDVAGSLNLFSSSDTQIHQMNACPYDLWPGHVHMDMEPADINEASSGQEGKMDLINCSEMHNGDLAEADQTCHSESVERLGPPRNEEGVAGDALPDVVDTDETTPTEAEAEWLGLDRVPTRLHMDESSEKQKD